MSDSRPPEDPRKITYRVGWKSGTIQLQDKDKRSANAARPPQGGVLSDYRIEGEERPRSESPAGGNPVPAAKSDRVRNTVEQVMDVFMKPAPLPPERVWRYLLWIVPAAAFSGTCWLAYMMSAYR
jgi:hypothetical protein